MPCLQTCVFFIVASYVSTFKNVFFGEKLPKICSFSHDCHRRRQSGDAHHYMSRVINTIYNSAANTKFKKSIEKIHDETTYLRYFLKRLFKFYSIEFAINSSKTLDMRQNTELGNNSTSLLTYLLMNILKSQLKIAHKPGLFGNSRRLIEALASEWLRFFRQFLEFLELFSYL